MPTSILYTINSILTFAHVRREEILKIIKQKKGVSAREITTQVGLTKAIVFRHLKRLSIEGKIFKIGHTPKVKYYYHPYMESKTTMEQKFMNWAITGGEQFTSPDWFCRTRDVFHARQERLLATLKNAVSENALFLLVSAAGEIGNNSFDHNLGNWRDIIGTIFAVDETNKTILLADRGQGVLFTIKRVRPQIETNEEALRAAFTEIISGRAPEQRGNGLKFTRKVISENNLYLEFYSGNALAQISGQNFTIKQSDIVIPGTLAIIKY